MFVSELTSDADYFLVGEDFASLSYDGTSVKYTFDVYGRLIQGLIDGNDEVEISIIRNTDPRLKYFQGKSKAEVEKSIIGFVQNTKQQLQEALADATIVTKTITLSTLLPDETVSDIGSKKINETNYVDFLPVIEQTTVNSTTKQKESVVPTDIAEFSKLTKRVFTKSGIHPGQVASIAFPAQKLTENGDGVAGEGRKQLTEKLLANEDFKDYYENYFLRSTQTTISRETSSQKAEYQKFQIDFELDLDEYNLGELLSYQNLSVRIALINDGIPVNSKLFRFDNQLVFQEATAGARKIEVDIVSYDPKFVLPDRLKITNRENYDVEITAFEFTTENNEIAKSQLLLATLSQNEDVEISASTIYFDANESRSYAVTANKAIPGVSGVSNVLSLVSPASTSTPPKANREFAINVTPITGQNSAKIMIAGVDFDEQDVMLYRKNITSGEKKLIAILTNRNTFADTDIQLGDIYLYSGEVQRNGAKGYGFASTGYIATNQGSSERVNFSLTNKKTAGRYGTVHSFKIVESIEASAAQKLLDAANQSGQAGNFENELEQGKADTSVITSYSIFRLAKKSATVQYLGDHSAGSNLRFNVDSSGQSRGEEYEYIVLPKASSIAALSYSTVVQETDLRTGSSYSLINKKWRDSNFPRAENLPSYSEVTKNDIALAFSNLPPSTYESMTFSTNLNYGRVQNLDAVSRQNSDCAFISWTWSGDIRNVLHFVVMASYNGYKAPIGLSMPDLNSTSDKIISYCDERLGDVSGDVRYSIIPVSVTGDRLQESSTVSVDSTKKYPTTALRKN